MNLRADHVAGAAFVVFGGLLIALSGDLPTGQLSMPGAGFLPKIVATLMIVLGFALASRARESAPLADIGWDDLTHAASVVGVTAVGIALYSQLGFILTMVLMLLGLLILVERRNVIRASLYSVVVVLLAFGLFGKILKAPLLTGPFGF